MTNLSNNTVRTEEQVVEAVARLMRAVMERLKASPYANGNSGGQK